MTQSMCVNKPEQTVAETHVAATRFSTRLSTHLMSNFTDSLHGRLIECWVVVDV